MYLCKILVPPNNYKPVTRFVRNFAHIQGGREISAIILTDDYLCYKELKTPHNFFLILIFNELLKI